MTHINWQENPLSQTESTKHRIPPSIEAGNNPWIGATMALIGVIIGFLGGKFM